MDSLKRKILTEGVVKEGSVLKVDKFLNHQIDIAFYQEIGKEFYRLFQDAGINKILTVEASGIGLACIVATYFNVPVLFAKKAASKNLDGEEYNATVHSFTKGKDYTMRVASRYLGPQDRVLIIDDFLARGNAILGLWNIIEQAQATLVGAGIVIEKGFQDGGRILREKGLRLESLAIIDKMDENQIIFRDEA